MQMIITPTKEQRSYAIMLTKEGNENFKRDFNPNKQTAFNNKAYGNLGEVVIADLLKIERKKPSKHSDGGFDLIIDNKKTDVKVQTSFSSPINQTYGWNIQETTMDFDVAENVLFLHWNKKTFEMTIIGWIEKQSIKDVAIYHKEGTINPTTNKPFWCSLYEVPTNKLKNFQAKPLESR